MRITPASFSGRNAYYDRNPLTPSGLASTQTAIAPHAGVQRWTYTVPTARKAIVQSCHALVSRVTAAGTLGVTEMYVSRPTSTAAILADGFMIKNNIGDQDRTTIGVGLVAIAGEQIQATDYDTGTTGTVSFNSSAGITEFDA